MPIARDGRRLRNLILRFLIKRRIPRLRETRHVFINQTK